MKKSQIKVLEIILGIIVFIGVVGGGIGFGVVVSNLHSSGNVDNLKKFQPSIPTKIYDVNGELVAELFKEKRELVTFEDLPDSLINAFLATEDKDFYNHIGISPVAIIRAMGKNIVAGRIVQGGSTITQQLAKRIFTSSQKTYSRKMLEALLALQIEQKFSKEEILEMYFNQIYLGQGCYGVASAAKLYFDKEVKYLNVAECSLLAALPSAPNELSPLRNPHAAYAKNKDILSRMVREGYLTEERADYIYQNFWPEYINKIKTEYPTKTVTSNNTTKAPYFVDYVRQNLIARFGKDVVYNEGLNVYTTLDLRRQEIAEKHMADKLVIQNEKSSKANERYNNLVDRSLFSAYDSLRTVFTLPEVVISNDVTARFKKYVADSLVDSADLLTLFTGSDACNKSLQNYRSLNANLASNMNVEGAFISVEPKTGYITAMIGGSGFKVDNQYNRAVQARRQPGSAFKPYVYGAAIEAGTITAATALPDAPILDMDESGKTWSPANYEGNYNGLVRVRRALAGSINIISIRIYDRTGPDAIINYASKMLKAPTSRFSPGPALSLGSTELTPLEMATGYAIYANEGRDVIPYAIRYVLDRDGNELVNVEEEVGKIIASKEKDGTIQVISPEVAFVMTTLMREVVDHGTARNTVRNVCKFKKEAAGKTGSSSNWSDAWFCGFTSDLVAIVWIGYDKAYLSLGKHQSGSGVAAPVWANYMRDVYNGMKEPHFSGPPANVYRASICSYSGLAPSENCSDVIGEWFIKGHGVSGVCDGNHQKMQSIDDLYLQQEGLAFE